MKKETFGALVLLALSAGCAGGGLEPGDERELEPGAEDGGDDEPAKPQDADLIVAGSFDVNVTISDPGTNQTLSPFVWGAGLNTRRDSAAQYLERVGGLESGRSVGVTQTRFPGGCNASMYRWKGIEGGDGTAAEYGYWGTNELQLHKVLSVDEALSMSDQLGADMLYTVNLAYNQDWGSPCGWRQYNPYDTPEQFKAVLIAEAVELVETYGHRIRRFELGNEPWGSFPPTVYRQVAREFATAMKAVDPAIEIGIVGYPTSGNNQSTGGQTAPSDSDALWTTEIQAALADDKCGGLPCFDFVTDHMYTYAGYRDHYDNDPENFEGKAAYWPVDNLETFLDQREQDYATAGREVGIARTEWNLKCWTHGSSDHDIPLTNDSFESGTDGWLLYSQGGASSVHGIATSDDGSQALRLTTQAGADGFSQSYQRFAVAAPTYRGDGSIRDLYQVKVRVRTTHPEHTHIIAQQSNGGEHQWHHMSESSLRSVGADGWYEASLFFQPFDDTREVQLVFRNAVHPDEVVTSNFDDVSITNLTHYSPMQDSVGTVEHAFFVAENLLKMAFRGVKMASYWQFSSTPRGCSLFNGGDQGLAAAGAGFQITSGLAGARALHTAVGSPSLVYPQDVPDSNGNTTIRPRGECTAAAWCIDAVETSAPYVSVYAAYTNSSPESKADSVTAIALNRHDDDEAVLSIGLDALDVDPSIDAEVTILQGDSFTDLSFQDLASFTVPVGSEIIVPAHSMAKIVYRRPNYVQHQRLELSRAFELVEDVAVGTLDDGSEAVLAVYHEPTGQGGELTSNGIGTRHSELMTRVSTGAPQLVGAAPRRLSTAPAPTAFAQRVEQHAAAAFDEDRQAFVVASLRRYDTGSTDENGWAIVRQALLLSEVHPTTGAVSPIADYDIGQFRLADGSENPLFYNDPDIDLVRTSEGFVLVYGHGGNVLNTRGDALVMGRFSLPSSGVADLNTIGLDLRVVPATERAKWPNLTVDDSGETVALSWTQSVGSFGNRIAVLGYRDATDQLFAPGGPLVDFAASQGLASLTVAEGTIADSAFESDGAFSHADDRFHLSYTHLGEQDDWEVVQRSLVVAPSLDPQLHDHTLVSDTDATWSYSGQIEATTDGTMLVVHEDDSWNFFDGVGAVTLDVVGTDGTILGRTQLVSQERQLDRVRVVASETSPWAYVVHSGRDGAFLDAVQWSQP